MLREVKRIRHVLIEGRTFVITSRIGEHGQAHWIVGIGIDEFLRPSGRLWLVPDLFVVPNQKLHRIGTKWIGGFGRGKLLERENAFTGLLFEDRFLINKCGISARALGQSRHRGEKKQKKCSIC